jgi:predicted RNA-binding Zn ribbon-like protein
MVPDRYEALLLALLNSTPVVRSQVVDDLADGDTATATLRGWGGTGTTAELAAVRAARADLQTVVRAERPADVLGAHLTNVAQTPTTDDGRLAWQLTAAPHRLLAARAVLAFFALAEQAPGRLRPCENGACRLFLIDHSRAGTARWCSMAACGNRMKARRHANRTREADSEP